MSDAPEASTITKRDVNDLIESFGPATTPEPTPAEKEIAKRISQAEAAYRGLVQKLTSLGIADGNLIVAGTALRRLQDSIDAVRQAIQTIPVGKLSLSATEGAPAKPRAPRKPRESVPAVAPEPTPEPEAATETAAEPEPATVEDDGTGFPMGAPKEETAAEIDARIKASRATRSGPAAKAPAATAPESEEGF